jgi:hypothetical protein
MNKLISISVITAVTIVALVAILIAVSLMIAAAFNLKLQNDIRQVRFQQEAQDNKKESAAAGYAFAADFISFNN